MIIRKLTAVSLGSIYVSDVVLIIGSNYGCRASTSGCVVFPGRGLGGWVVGGFLCQAK